MGGVVLQVYDQREVHECLANLLYDFSVKCQKVECVSPKEISHPNWEQQDFYMDALHKSSTSQTISMPCIDSIVQGHPLMVPEGIEAENFLMLFSLPKNNPYCDNSFTLTADYVSGLKPYMNMRSTSDPFLIELYDSIPEEFIRFADVQKISIDNRSEEEIDLESSSSNT